MNLEKEDGWVNVLYPDNSMYVFRGTRNLELVQILNKGNLPDYDVYLDDEKTILLPQYIYDIKKCNFFDTDGLNYTVSEEPEFKRRIDKYANSFI